MELDPDNQLASICYGYYLNISRFALKMPVLTRITHTELMRPDLISRLPTSTQRALIQH